MEASTCSKLYWLLAVFRVLIVFAPQTGYIHPDEFFQSVEVLAGRSFDVAINQPWEFNWSFPIRSAAVPYLTVTTSFFILKILHYFSRLLFDVSLIQPYFVLVAPRLMVSLLSFTVDYSLYKICRENNEKYRAKLLILASSFVVLIFGSRTFSNSLELILFSLLLWYVSDSIIFTNILVRKREYLNLRYTEAKNAKQRAELHKLRLYLSSDLYKNCFRVSFISVLGFFNRPTFLGFAVAPVFFWLYRGIGSKSVMSVTFHMRMFAFVICCIPTILVAIIIDSFFYGYISWGEIGMLDVSIKNFVFTPLNFMTYNVEAGNLAIHGLHPKYLHVMVNIPLLFNVLGLLAIFGFIQILHRLLKCQYHHLPPVRSLKAMMTLSVIIPVALLSYFPHQEPRFLIPILLPLVYLYSSEILEEPDLMVIKMKKSDLEATSDTKSAPKIKKHLLKFWLCFNLICFVLFGFVHQGGVVPLTLKLSDRVNARKDVTQFHVVTSFIYPIPQFMFLQPKQEQFRLDKRLFPKRRRVVFYEEGSRNISSVLDKLQDISDENNGKRSKIYLIIPSSLRESLSYVAESKSKLTVFPKLTDTFYPHISFEAPPNMNHHCLEIGVFTNCITSAEKVSLANFGYILASMCGLDLYEIH